MSLNNLKDFKVQTIWGRIGYFSLINDDLFLNLNKDQDDCDDEKGYLNYNLVKHISCVINTKTNKRIWINCTNTPCLFDAFCGLLFLVLVIDLCAVVYNAILTNYHIASFLLLGGILLFWLCLKGSSIIHFFQIRFSLKKIYKFLNETDKKSLLIGGASGRGCIRMPRLIRWMFYIGYLVIFYKLVFNIDLIVKTIWSLLTKYI